MGFSFSYYVYRFITLCFLTYIGYEIRPMFLAYVLCTWVQLPPSAALYRIAMLCSAINYITPSAEHPAAHTTDLRFHDQCMPAWQHGLTCTLVLYRTIYLLLWYLASD